MRTSQRGVDFIRQFEGLSLTAVRLQGEQHYTIGYGHYGSDVSPGQQMTLAQAEALFKQDLIKFESWVKQYAPWPVNQNEFDALVSFTYNCGPGNLRKLVKGFTKAAVADRFLLYTGSASPAFTQGLLRRRQQERAIFLEEVDQMDRWQTLEDVPQGYYRQQVQRLISEGVLAGTDGGLDLTVDMLRGIIMAERSCTAKLEGLKARLDRLEGLR